MWNSNCAKIFTDYTTKLNNEYIRYFVLRNYKLLPEGNESKDVDIVVDPKESKRARVLLKEIYTENDIEYYDETRFGKVLCTHGMSLKRNMGIHIDLVCGYRSKGYEIYTFDELYNNAAKYKDFYALTGYMNGIMLLIYKLFGYRKPELKELYKEEIYDCYKKYQDEFTTEVIKLYGRELSIKIIEAISEKDFDSIIKNNKQLTKRLKKYSRKRSRIKTAARRIGFLWQKFFKVIIGYLKYKKVVAILGPDGVGKSTFLDMLINKLNYYYVSDSEDGKFDVLHFRPTVFPNLGEIGEKTGAMEQDTNFTDPHRNKPANPISSFFRIAYYTFDYIIGWQKCVRDDVRMDRYTIFDRYSYDLIVDPKRTRLNLPKAIRRFFVWLTPRPGVVFILTADADTIYNRKQELSKEEIERHLEEYRWLSSKHDRFRIIDANKTPDEITNEAVEILFDKYAR